MLKFGPDELMALSNGCAGSTALGSQLPVGTRQGKLDMFLIVAVMVTVAPAG
jgi:hypothetical protein